MYVDLIDSVAASHFEIAIDGTTIEGDYLLVEVLNMPSVGPNVRLTSEVNPADGLLSVVVAAESDRPALAAYLRARAIGERSGRCSQVVARQQDYDHRPDRFPR